MNNQIDILFIEVKERNYEKLSRILKSSTKNFNIEYKIKLVEKSSEDYFESFDIIIFEDSIFQSDSHKKTIEMLNIIKNYPSILISRDNESVSYKDVIELGFIDAISFNECTEEKFPNLITETVNKRRIQKRVKDRKEDLEKKLKESTNKIQESEKKFKLIFNNTKDAIFIHELGGNFLEVNQTACKRLGYTKEELLKLNPQEIDSPKYSKKVSERINELLEKEETFFETEHLTKEGKHIPIELSSRIIDYDGSKAVLSIARDISERKRKEKELRKAKKKYENLFNEMELIFDHIPALLFFKDKENNYIRVNQYVADAHNLSKEELEGKNISDFYSEEQAKAYWEDDLQVINSEKPKLFIEEKWNTEKGERWVSTSKIPLKDDSDDIIGIIGFSIDITEQKIAEEKLKKSERKYRSFIENAQEGIWALDKSGFTTFVNQRMANLLGYSTREMEGKHLFTFLDEEGVQKAKEKLKARKSGLKESHDFKFIKKKGNEVFTRLEASPLLNESGEYQGSIAYVRDITNIKKAEERLKRSKLKYEMLFENSPVALWEIDLSQIKKEIKRLKKFSEQEFLKFANSHPEKVSELISLIDKINVNKKGLELMEVNNQDEIFDTIDDFLTPEAINVFKKMLLSLLKNEDSFESSEFPITVAGKTLYMIMKMNLIPGGKRDWSRILISFSDITDRKIFEDKLKRSEEKYRLLTENAHDFIYVVNKDQRFEYINAKVFKTTMGYEKEDLINQKITKTSHQEDKEKIINKISKLFNSEVGAEIKYEARDRDAHGKYHWFEIKGKTFIDHKGFKKGLFIGRDITERKEYQKELELHHMAMESSMDGMAILNSEEKYIYLNDAHARLYGYENPGELLGKDWKNLYFKDEIQRFEEEILPILNRQGEWHGEAIGKKADGTQFFQELSLTHLKNGGIICVIRDITERKVAEKRLKESEKIYRSLIETAPYSIILINDQKRIVECNPATEDLTGYKKQELLGNKFNELDLFFNDENYEKLLDRYKNKIQGKETQPTEIRMKKKGGEIIWVKIKSNYVMREGKNYIQAMMHDITKRKNTELLEEGFKKQLEKEVEIRTKKLNEALKEKKKYIDEIIKASHFKDEFLATMSHELRTPLNAIIGFTDLLLEGSFGELNDQQREYLEDIKDSAQHQFDMIGGILDISKIEAGQLNLDYKKFSLNSIVDQIQSTLMPMYKQKGLDFKVEGLEDEIEIYADPIRIKQILYNLLSNAIKFTIEGYCKLILKEKYDRWIFKVKDTGIGIAKSDYDLVFKEFKRVQSSYVRSISGTGLGLSLTKRLVELHGGEISFTSFLGVGTTFKFYIPKKSEDDIF